MKKISKYTFILILSSSMVGCSSAPEIIVEPELIRVSKEIPMGDCEEIGVLRGTTMTVTGADQDTLEDLKQTAIDKGANYLKIIEISQVGISSTGVAYKCN